MSVSLPCKYGHTTGRYLSTNRCIECGRSSCRKWKRENREKIYADNRIWRKKNRDKVQAKERKWKVANPEKIKIIGRRWRLKNLEKRNFINAIRRARKLMATPKWLTEKQKAEILSFYKSANDLGLEVDHIIPLRGENVCGLHVPWNLQTLTATENRRKGNKMTG